MKKGKILSTILATMLTITPFAVGAAGCSKDNGGGSTETVDSSRTQLYVRNYQGGYGNKWLYQGKSEFEELYKDVSFEEGKKGVQVMITDIKETPNASNIKNDVYDVYFVEKLNYLSLVKQGVVADITEAVTGTNEYETSKTIESKLTDEQKAFYCVDGKYYALPHYFSSAGIVYDKDLFDEELCYFVKGYEAEYEKSSVNYLNLFVQTASDERSAGPDGEYGTSDDGLPATYEDFWYLCTYLKELGYTPLNWGGKSAGDYLSFLLAALAADYEGAEQYMLNTTFEGEMTDLVKITDGKIETDANGNIVTESVVLDPEKNNGYETYRNAGIYYALQFIHDLMANASKYTVYLNTSSTSYTAFDAQADYVASRLSSSSVNRQAMLIDGVWWDSEATEYFTKAGISKQEAHYAFMPLPKATREQVGKHNNNFLNIMDSLCFVKAGLSGKMYELAVKFVQYMNTDKAYEDFTAKTNAFKNFNYTLSDTTIASLSNYGKDLYEKRKTYDLINLYNNNEQFYNTTYTIQYQARYAIGTGSLVFAPNVFSANPKKTSAEYFIELYSYAKSAVWSAYTK